MTELFRFPVVFTNPFSGDPFYGRNTQCYVFEDEGEAWECYDYLELAKICHLKPDAFYEFCEQDHHPYITAMAFVEMCFYSSNLLSYSTDREECVSLPALQDMAIDLLGAAANAHWPAQAMINEQKVKQ